jgi:hypothetical protein
VRVRLRLAVLALAGAMVATTPAALAVGPGNPLSPALPQEQATIPTTTTSPPPVLTTSASGASSLSGSGIAAIAVGALAILGGISVYIWRDARRRAPVRQSAAAAAAGAGGRPGSKPKAKPRKLSAAERRRRKRGRAR